MKTKSMNPVVITEEDYNLLKPLAGSMEGEMMEMSLGHELSRAIIVKNDAFPPHTVRLNSKVTVLNLETERIMNFMIVLPEQADMGKQQVSVLTPLGTALIGFRKGEEVLWRVPAGLKRFRILDVCNS
jgi:regulator of nucleoside diphosphate kinase